MYGLKGIIMGKIYRENSEANLIDFMGSDKRVVDSARVSFLKDDITETKLTER